MKLFADHAPQRINVYTDGSIRPDAGSSGLAAIARDVRGNVLHLWSKRAGKMT